ncbi:alpha/beta hydrolase [Aspergillus mulundensis]|uniref:Alpha/beta hydrolase fold-3 domain-containing protein n=1 Tax=Aspergillus mulundensis TaxID=1810919 RepID=A0A3D8QV25_9EURO|nr:Uncharacterized protein DSM5745_09435 [Aspergillus mulundensis]RDW65696.1 Uncharacterized protein DSM5745_09435 [Aspergillus mulundensis]
MGDFGVKNDIPVELAIDKPNLQVTDPDEPQYSDEQIAMSRPDPEFAALFNTPFPSGGFFTSAPITELRAQHAAMEKAACDKTSTLNTRESIIHIRMRDGHLSETRIIRPATPPEAGSPLIILIYGGGYLLGTNRQLLPFARALSALFNATTVTVSYRLAPEWKFPTSPNDVWDAVTWLAEHAALLGANPSRGFILGGVSAGGQLTALTAQRAVKENLSPRITGLWVSVPVTTLTADGIPEEYREAWVSRSQNGNAPVLDVRDIKFAEDAVRPDLDSDLFSPFVHGYLASRLPRTYVQVAGLDPLRDDGLVYERYLRDAGVETRLDVYRGLPHCHYAFFPGLEASRRFCADVLLGVGWLLGREVGREEVVRAAGGALGL